MPVPSASRHVARLLREILTSRVYDVARETSLDSAEGLSARVGAEVLLKREDLQPVFSFKLRGAYNKVAHLSEDERARGVVCASAGNHAQGVAYAARALGVDAVVVMPQTTPEIKVRAVRGMDAEVVLVGDDYTAAQRHADALGAERGLSFVHPFDDPLVVAGQGTIADELRRQCRGRLSAVFVPIGGGGLIAGIAGYFKTLMPEVRVIGVEPFDSDAMYQSLAAGHRVELDHVGIFADGTAVRQVGELTFSVVKDLVDEVVRVSNDEICAAIKDIFDDTRSIMEPAGALAVAGLKTWTAVHREADQRLVAILSGANMNFDRLRFVAERAELGEAREAVFGVTIPERAGAFREFCAAIGPRVITEFNYRLSGREQAHIFVGVGTTSREDAAVLREQLGQQGYDTVDLSDDEMAKLHVRHMVGGRVAGVRQERACRFEFPERPGALMDFLESLSGRWNISLFHYRNHGADFGRVLASFEVPDDELEQFELFLSGLGYHYELQSGNVAYDMFLA
ncbi:MAG: threonine ammonia-lyase, biosynthetic [Acidobacteria bacterium]|jgi:threonine dehydratase|nr:threonine ammonia-lyase, biosynthetic [Acidobacteriota bacterium]MDP7478231.1 threonine ammonia-lyase, biosynthetic [Vicinamibacterales bacterium]MDP7691317.1 threonine ammonia-lyase, biosynthetic [Vicinamibacterales bacterium]HJN43410.1 threonine ammonia-lyase, biosynthetic [Vicinamibacterales bacterium]